MVQQRVIVAAFALASACLLLVSVLPVQAGHGQEHMVGNLRLPSLQSMYSGLKSILASDIMRASSYDMPKQERMRLLKVESEWKNNLVMWAFPQHVRDNTSHFVQTWIRCGVLCAAVYIVVGGAWCWYAYLCFGDVLYKPGTIPALKDMLEQVKVSMLSMPLYSLLPTITEWSAENGFTLAYPRISNVGMPMYVLYFFLYMTSVEFFVYWMHRGLHEIKWAYKLLHRPHHKYNKEHTLSPFAGLAFHPIDGICQALPYTFTLFYCPMHFLTHELLLFATGIWTTNIHDCIHGKVAPIMGAGYHTIHHIDYKSNYGHYFIFMDYLFGSLLHPEDFEEQQAVKASKASGSGQKVAAQ